MSVIENGYSENDLKSVLDRIVAFDEESAIRAERHSDNLTKPPGSLGKLEAIARQLAGITGVLWPDLSRKAVIIMAGDHGVCEEGISAFPQAVTPQMVLNFLNGGAAVNVLARHANADVVCVDIGVASDLEHKSLISRKVVRGTRNMVKEPAMTREETIKAIMIGVSIVDEQVKNGVRIFATGEMGIGNTTASAAITAVLAGMSPAQAVGRGTGINDETFARKIDVVQRALTLNKPDQNDPIDVLAKVGGAEIAGLVGVIIGAAANGCPVVIDGYISSTAALIAAKLSERTSPYMIASHLSQEQGHLGLMKSIGLSPLIQLEMRLGEGTGAVLCFHLIDASLKLMQEMATFDSAGISKE
ncbi:nicotinate-nucleotide--dimethylbenzimidazole phosphoribosyltransferase [Paenibacillus sp. GSMTC-2017]|uniref:nicotinate-nucleotide--dimethylbenzimidazole phosphoribosyltransferase n=1 Tax=Paenibacillus sp. GSMTC-2017 TaxID=2794350 RepID=UPI0018DA00F8|nr:nicotinate-nucleotide--dimethylbenzimidazole phosphoribosyltransferase [Paenibacillus sp. GSMTC-2017]MBH5316498.1 nicotinate-nucleotide--dimethylbenzimidazole phosphoribosyltransferase [Paenibacillus sp. GSMTC-2017]